VFYEQAGGKSTPLLLGTAVEMTPRAIPVGVTARPSFLVNLPTANISEIRIAADLVEGKNGPFQRIDVTATPVDGKPGAYTISPKTDLPPGLCAVIIGSDDRILDDRNNVYPFVVGQNPTPTPKPTTPTEELTPTEKPAAEEPPAAEAKPAPAEQPPPEEKSAPEEKPVPQDNPASGEKAAPAQ